MRTRQSLALATVLLSTLVGCARHPDEYVGSNGSGAIYIAWTSDTTGHIQGQLQAAAINSSDPTRLDTRNSAFTGTIRETDVSIAFPALSNFSGQTWTGKAGSGALVLTFPNQTNGISQMTL